MFSWLSKLSGRFSQWNKSRNRRRTYRRRRAPIVTVPVGDKNLGKVYSGKFRRQKDTESSMYTLRIVMLAVIVAIVLIAIVAAGYTVWQIRHAERVQWEWLNELMGTESMVSSSEESSVLPPQEEAAQEDDLLIYAGKNHPLPENFIPQLSRYEGVLLDTRAVESLSLMTQTMKTQKIEVSIVGGYVSAEEQERIYQEKLSGFYDRGYSKVRAEDAAAGYKNGCSDFQTGLTLRVESSENADFKDSPAYRWLKTYGAEYGFVFRYPEGKKSFTNTEPDPTVLRFVGPENAVQMLRFDMCLEEYADYIEER